jgi:hypothetical protein
MLSNLLALKIVSTLTMSINSLRRFMGSSKPQAWYECLRDFLIANGFKVRKADPTLFTKTIANDLFYAKFMLMISYLGLLTNLLVKSLVG